METRIPCSLLFGMALAAGACGVTKAEGGGSGGSGNVPGTQTPGGGSGGAAASGTGGGDAGAGSPTTGSLGSGGVGGAGSVSSAGGQNVNGACVGDGVPVPASACACDSQVAACQAALASECGGKPCPATLDEALLVASWPLTVATQDLIGWVHGDYFQWSDGTSSFTVQGTGLYYAVFYGIDGRLSFAYKRTGPVTTDGGGTTDDVPCVRSLCGTPPQLTGTQASPSNTCQMLAQPPAKGWYDQVCQQSGQFNGGPFDCEVDDEGRWSMPCSDLN